MPKIHRGKIFAAATTPSFGTNLRYLKMEPPKGMCLHKTLSICFEAITCDEEKLLGTLLFVHEFKTLKKKRTRQLLIFGVCNNSNPNPKLAIKIWSQINVKSTVKTCLLEKKTQVFKVALHQVQDDQFSLSLLYCIQLYPLTQFWTFKF